MSDFSRHIYLWFSVENAFPHKITPMYAYFKGNFSPLIVKNAQGKAIVYSCINYDTAYPCPHDKKGRTFLTYFVKKCTLW